MEAQLFLGSRTEKELVIDRKFEFNFEHTEIEIPMRHSSDMQCKWTLRYMGLKHGRKIWARDVNESVLHMNGN